MSISASELAGLIGAKVVGDSEVMVDGVAKIEEATDSEVTFVANKAYKKFIQQTNAAIVIADECDKESDVTFLVTPDPYVSFLKALRYFHPEDERPASGIHPSTVVGKDVTIGKNVSVGPNCVLEDNVNIGDNTILRGLSFVGKNVTIGVDCLFHSRVSVRESCIIGNRVILQDGAVIGSDGFGFAPGEEGYLKVPQVGNVVIEDDVEIGANTTVDRATLGKTTIRRGVKLDNLVQIAHNVEIGESTVMAAQGGVAGSTRIGKYSMFGGQVGINGHMRLSDGVKAAAQSGIVKDPGENQIVGGSPARLIREWQRVEASLRRLPELLQRVKKLESE